MRTKLAMVLCGSVLAWGSVLSASPIVMADSAANKPHETALPDPTFGIGGEGYVLFDYDNTGSPADYKSGVASSGYAAVYSTVGDSKTGSGVALTTSAGTYATGIAYHSGAPIGQNTNVVTFTLGAGVPSSFVLSVLMDNYGGTPANNDDSEVTVTASGGSSDFQTIEGNVPAHADFYSFLISGAVSGDTISIGATPASTDGSESTALVGGVAFNAVPEPGSILLATLGCMGLLLLRKRRLAL